MGGSKPETGWSKSSPKEREMREGRREEEILWDNGRLNPLWKERCVSAGRRKWKGWLKEQKVK